MDGQQAAGHEAVAEILGRLAAHAGVECFVSQCEFAGGQGLQHDGDSAAQPPHDIVQIRAGAGAQVVDQRLQCRVGEDRGRNVLEPCRDSAAIDTSKYSEGSFGWLR